MGFLSRVFRQGASGHYVPPTDAEKQAIMLLGMSGDFQGLARKLKSSNPHVRAFTVEAVVFAGRTRSIGGGQRHFRDGTAAAPDAIRLLTPLLDDDDELVRQAAERAVASVKSR